jgi:hypothetical protein
MCGFTADSQRNKIITEGLTSPEEFTQLMLDGLGKMTDRLEHCTVAQGGMRFPYHSYQNLQAVIYWASDKMCHGQAIVPEEFMFEVMR